MLKRERECPLNIGRMLKKLPTKFKYNVAIYKLNVYKTSIKKSPLIHIWALRKILNIKIFWESSIVNIENRSR